MNNKHFHHRDEGTGMAKKKWFGLAAVGTAIVAGAAIVIKKVKESPEKASEVVGAVKDKVSGTSAEAASEVESIDEDTDS